MVMASFPKTRIVLSWPIQLFLKTRSNGTEHIPSSGPFVVVANHASVLDPILVGYTSREREVSFMAKEELFRIPLLGTLIRSCGAFPVRRGQWDREAIQKFQDFIHSGKPIALFPEGTRTLTGELQPARKGVGMLIYNARVAVVPAYIDGTFRAWPKGKLLPRPGKTSVTYGPVIPLDDLYLEEAGKPVYLKIAARIMENIARLKAAKPV
jgi:1-acyl-sn-glycerol-3-phosphate acyltransferase